MEEKKRLSAEIPSSGYVYRAHRKFLRRLREDIGENIGDSGASDEQVEAIEEPTRPPTLS